jgi:hypothetical protein
MELKAKWFVVLAKLFDSIVEGSRLASTGPEEIIGGSHSLNNCRKIKIDEKS